MAHNIDVDSACAFLRGNTKLHKSPSILNGQNVIVSQEQQRKLFDTLNTAIMGFPNNNQYAANYFSPGNYLQAQKQYVPGGMAFCFNTLNPFFAQTKFPYNETQFNNTFTQNAQCYPQPLQQHVMVNSLQPSPQQQLDAMQHKLMQCQKDLTEIMDVQQSDIQNQSSWKFHKNVGTTSEDLLKYHTQTPGSQSTPDFSNISGINQQAPAICHSKVKKLTLSQSEKSKGHVSDILDGDENEKKQVSFTECGNEIQACNEEDQVKEMIDKSQQASLSRCCCSSDSEESDIEKLYSCMEEELFCDHCRQLLEMMKSRMKKSKKRSKRKNKDYDSSYCSTSDTDY